jgi:hypothetical protein
MVKMATKFGIREVTDVKFIDMKTGETLAYIDTLQLKFDVEEPVYAKGGKGSPKILGLGERSVRITEDNSKIDKGELSKLLGYNVK